MTIDDRPEPLDVEFTVEPERVDLNVDKAPVRSQGPGKVVMWVG